MVSGVSQVQGKYSYPKQWRLHHRSLVEGLFRKGKSFYEFPFRVTWRILSPKDIEDNFRNNPPAGIGVLQMMVTVPKKKRKRAVDRVLMRRRIREAYRLNSLQLRDDLLALKDFGTMSLSLVYIHDQNLPYATIDDKIRAVLKKLKGITPTPANQI